MLPRLCLRPPSKQGVNVLSKCMCSPPRRSWVSAGGHGSQRSAGEADPAGARLTTHQCSPSKLTSGVWAAQGGRKRHTQGNPPPIPGVKWTLASMTHSLWGHGPGLCPVSFP